MDEDVVVNNEVKDSNMESGVEERLGDGTVVRKNTVVEDIESSKANEAEMSLANGTGGKQTDVSVVGTTTDAVDPPSDVIGNETEYKSPNTSTSMPYSMESDSNNQKSSFDSVVGNNNVVFDKKSCYVPPVTCDDGSEVVIFEEELVMMGSAKWELTICGYFVGSKMSFNELRHNLIRMWGKYGLGEMFTTSNDVFCFKFKHKDGMNVVIESSPWMVGGRPLLVRK